MGLITVWLMRRNSFWLHLIIIECVLTQSSPRKFCLSALAVWLPVLTWSRVSDVVWGVRRTVRLCQVVYVHCSLLIWPVVSGCLYSPGLLCLVVCAHLVWGVWTEAWVEISPRCCIHQVALSSHFLWSTSRMWWNKILNCFWKQI